MTPVGLAALVEVLRKTNFVSDKLHKLFTAAETNDFSVLDVVALIMQLPFVSDRTAAVKQLRPKMLPATCDDIITLMRCFDFGYERLEVLDIVAELITDIDFDFLIVRQFNFAAEQQKAVDIMARLRPPPGLHVDAGDAKSEGVSSEEDEYALPDPDVDPATTWAARRPLAADAESGRDKYSHDRSAGEVRAEGPAIGLEAHPEATRLASW